MHTVACICSQPPLPYIVYTRDWISLASPIALHILTDGDNGLGTSVVLVQHSEFYLSFSFKSSRDSNFSLVLVLITKSQKG